MSRFRVERWSWREFPRWAIWDEQRGVYVERASTASATGRAIRLFTSLAAAEVIARRMERLEAKRRKSP